MRDLKNGETLVKIMLEKAPWLTYDARPKVGT